MLPVRKGNKYGFISINKEGKYNIEPRYENVFAVYKEGAIVQLNGGYGLIDSNENILIPFIHQNLIKEAGIYHGKRIIRDSKLPRGYDSYLQNMYYSNSGEQLFIQRAHDQSSFQPDQKYAWFRFGSDFYCYDKKGNQVKSINYAGQNQFIGIHDDLFCFREKRGDKFYYSARDLENNLRFEIGIEKRGYYNGIFKLSANLYALIDDWSNISFCDGEGNLKPYRTRLSLYEFKTEPYYQRDYYRVGNSEREEIGVINRDGEFIIPPNYSRIGTFVNGMAYTILKENKKNAFINLKGDEVGILPRTFSYNFEHYDQLLNLPIGFYEGLGIGKDLLVTLDTLESGKVQKNIDFENEYYFFFNHKGERVVELDTTINLVGPFSNGYAAVFSKQNGIGFINKSGSWVIQPKYEASAIGSYPFPALVIPKFIGEYAYIKSKKGYIDLNGEEYFSGDFVKDQYNFSH